MSCVFNSIFKWNICNIPVYKPRRSKTIHSGLVYSEIGHEVYGLFSYRHGLESYSFYIKYWCRLVPGEKNNLLDGDRQISFWWWSHKIIWRSPYNYVAVGLNLSGGRQISLWRQTDKIFFSPGTSGFRNYAYLQKLNFTWKIFSP